MPKIFAIFAVLMQEYMGTKSQRGNIWPLSPNAAIYSRSGEGIGSRRPTESFNCNMQHIIVLIFSNLNNPFRVEFVRKYAPKAKHSLQNSVASIPQLLAHQNAATLITKNRRKESVGALLNVSGVLIQSSRCLIRLSDMQIDVYTSYIDD